MNTSHAIIGLGTFIAAIGLWWLLPGTSTRRALGGLLTTIGFGLIGSQSPLVGDGLADGLLAALGIATVVAAVATISCRSPVYCAIWFGMTLVGTAGLFLMAGAQFLAVATLVVYAGAILVTFLFVLMLSQPEGHTTYDRRSWEAMVSAFTGAVLVGILTTTIGASVAARAQEIKTEVASEHAALNELDRVQGVAPPGIERSTAGIEPLSISRLGAELFTRYLLAVEVAGTLLFAALVGAAVIVAQGRAAMKGRDPFARRGGTAHVA